MVASELMLDELLGNGVVRVSGLETGTLRGLDTTGGAAATAAGRGWLAPPLPAAAANAAMDCTLLIVTMGSGGALLPAEAAVVAGAAAAGATSAVSLESTLLEGNGFLGFPATMLCTWSRFYASVSATIRVNKT
jgi:hypothetical protein